MTIKRKISFSTRGNTDIINLTPLIEEELATLQIADGLVLLFTPGATGAITTIEYEPGLITDFRNMLASLIPQDSFYEHNQNWGDNNAHSHLRASLLGPELTVPLSGKKLVLGTWQQIIFVDFDVRPRSRTLIMQIIGD